VFGEAILSFLEIYLLMQVLKKPLEAEKYLVAPRKFYAQSKRQDRNHGTFDSLWRNASSAARG
jgi:hypothetical protein